ncbi:MAG: ABC transporter ATP-binding protein [Saccharospirillaceae bacterium]|nr:ABC transporter ATP-binding protein [Pseudomonadales bacterium]NRB78284.1 ABC transporter ATP-binding protein [Saccharospirillaceae bacterium]
MKCNLQCVNLTKSYQIGTETQVVLNDISASFYAGEIIAIMGSSGSGKSTLLNMLAGLDTPTKGEVLLVEQSYNAINENKISDLRNKHMGFVFQGHHLLSEFNALENVLMPISISGKPNKQQIDYAEQLLEQVGLSHRLKHNPSELSGGERQRVAIARSLVNQPDVILMDEPTGNLDDENTQQVHDLILKLNKEHQATFIIVTHNRELANALPKRYLLKSGKLIEVKDAF